MLTRILAVAITLLAALVVQQYARIGQLRTELAAVQARALIEARGTVADSMEGQGPEIERTIAWLQDFYKSPDGLQRPEGLWIDGHPDYAGIGAWVFDVYLRRRLRGDTEEAARRAVQEAITRSGEWKAKHPVI